MLPGTLYIENQRPKVPSSKAHYPCTMAGTPSPHGRRSVGGHCAWRHRRAVACSRELFVGVCSSRVPRAQHSLCVTYIRECIGVLVGVRVSLYSPLCLFATSLVYWGARGSVSVTVFPIVFVRDISCVKPIAYSASLGGIPFVCKQCAAAAKNAVNSDQYYSTARGTLIPRPLCGAGVTLGQVCGVGHEMDNKGQPVVLQCNGGGTISSIDFASFGTPVVSSAANACTNASFAVDPACDAPTSMQVVSALCLQHTSCTVYANITQFGGQDPCGGVPKLLAVRVAEGFYAIPICTRDNVCSNASE